jgi:hypothetical protein
MQARVARKAVAPADLIGPMITTESDEQHPHGEALLSRHLHRQSVGVLTSLRRVPRTGSAFRNRLLATASSVEPGVRNARAAIVPVLLNGCRRGGQRERAALGVPAHSPPIAGVDDRAAELADALECRGQVGDGEVGQGGGIAGARSTLVDSEAQAVGVSLPSGSARGGPWRERDPEDSAPKPAGAIGIVGRKLDQWCGHGLSMAGARARFSSARTARSVRSTLD